ncbi:MarR family winged helix-turn-helix transcriptional regulator [Bacillus sp. 1P06AnD]|uniref:MarR family winged helix-turn-helix transcriptional regulator n=1 Tax=Bacillus sp. 1P06AnD TaxID=3132208 RepID=UPI0039A249F6
MLKDDIGFAASSTTKLIRALINHELKQYHITSEQWTVLKQLSFVSDLNQKELSLRTDKDQATLTKILDLLEQRKLLKRKANPNDRRSYIVEITDQGRDLVDIVLPQVEELFESILAHLSEKQLDEFMAVLKQIRVNIEEIRKS